MTAYMLDTNICSFLIRERPPTIARQLDALTGEDTTAISSVVYFELRAGAALKNSSRLSDLITALIARLSDGVSPFDAEAAQYAAVVEADLSAKGQRISAYDVMIAGHALATNSVLVTNNTREFERVGGLRLADWV
jgi:tRNA(fMet)-specific endonuclease VapC